MAALEREEEEKKRTEDEERKNRVPPKQVGLTCMTESLVRRSRPLHL